MNLKYILFGAFLLVAIAGTYALYTTTTEPSERPPRPGLPLTNYATLGVATSTTTSEQKAQVKTIVTVTSDNTLGRASTTFLGDKTSQDFIHIAVQGTITDFSHLSITFDTDKIVREKVLGEIPSVTDKTITIGTTIPEGALSEMLVWKSRAGKEYTFIIGYDGENGKIYKTVEME
jgi:hypothetical protein